MAVEVELFGHLALNNPHQQLVEMKHIMTARELAIHLGLKLDEIGMVAINGKHEEMSEIVPKDGRVCYFPPLFGG